MRNPFITDSTVKRSTLGSGLEHFGLLSLPIATGKRVRPKLKPSVAPWNQSSAAQSKKPR